MIVTCPKCAAKYRVRDEAVPPGGAELECPECSAHFIAHPPSTEDLNRAIDKLTDAKETLEAKLEEVEGHLKAARAGKDEAVGQLQQLRSESMKALQLREEELGRIKAEVASKTNELGQMANDIGRLRSSADEASRMRDQLQAAQNEVSRLRDQAAAMSSLPAELELARQRISMLEAGGGGPNHKSAALEQEIATLKQQLAMSMASNADSGRTSLPPEIASMVAAMGPMLWGLEKAIEYLEPFSGNEPALAGHVRQLKTLAGIIKRLTADVT